MTKNRNKKWIFIPGFERYLINREGTVINACTGIPLKYSGRPYCYILTNDAEAKPVTVSVRKILKKEFGVVIPVNKPKGNPNMSSFNVAFHSKPVICKDVTTFQETRFKNTHEAERELGLYAGCVSKFCSGMFKSPVRNQYEFRYDTTGLE